MFQRGFLREHGSIAALLYAVTDIVAIVLGAVIAYYFRFGTVALSPSYRSVVSIGVLLALLFFPRFQLYDSWRGRSLADQARNITIAWVTSLLVLIAIGFVVKSSERFSRLWIGEWVVIGWFLLIAARCFVTTVLWVLRRRGWNLRKIIVVGDKESARDAVARVQNTPWSGLQIFCIVDDSADAADRSLGLRVHHRIDDLERLITRAGVDEVWICLPLREQQRIDRTLHALRHSTANVRLLPDTSGVRLLSHPVTDVLGMPLVNLNTSPMQGVNLLLKAIEDRVLACIILILVSPFLTIIALAVKATSKGPVIYTQRRHGWNGRAVNIYKFRSMVVHRVPEGTVPQATCADPRITPLGRFLRRTSLDELPQFFNVLKGDMSIVGPRPHAVEHNDEYKEQIDAYMQRHRVKPGITGWAQINGWRGETDTLDKMRQRIEHDLYYIENWSVWLDLKIIFLTLFRGFIHPNAY